MDHTGSKLLTGVQYQEMRREHRKSPVFHGDCEPFHVPLIQMVGMIIGAPNLMQAFCSCYFTHVCAGVSVSVCVCVCVCVRAIHPHNKGKAREAE